MNVHFRHIVLSIVASVLFAACQDTDVPTIQGNEENSRAEKEVCLQINISPVEQNSRAADGGYESGADYIKGYIKGDNEYAVTENEVYCADYYFYNADGSFKERQTFNFPDRTVLTNGNIESKIGSRLFWWKKEECPSYLVVVLNSPDNKFDDKSLEALYDFKTEGMWGVMYIKEVGGVQKCYIVMTNSSYVGTSDNSHAPTQEGYYFAVPLKDEDFKDNYIDAENSPVNVYVERAAAKMDVVFKDGILKSNAPVSVDGKSSTVFGIPLKTRDNKQKYIAFWYYGFGASASEKETYYMKHIDPDKWGNNNASTWLMSGSWNMPTDFRSYWGMSINYNNYSLDNYATRFELENANVNTEQDNINNEEADATEVTILQLDKYAVNYYSIYDFQKGTGSFNGRPKYTNEHIPNVSQLKDMKDYCNVTHFVVFGRILGIVETENEIKNYNAGDAKKNYYRIGDMLWEEDELKKDLLASYKEDGMDFLGFNIFTMNGNNYTRLNEDSYEFTNRYNGHVSLGVKITEGTTYYYKEGNEYKEYDKEGNKTIAGLQADIDTFAKGYDIIGYKDGFMYYSVPIEHLGLSNNDRSYLDADYASKAQEGDYGVVRNHWYRLTINSFKSLGHGIFDIYEDIVPHKDSFYGLSFKMQVCPWHVKEYNITLDGTTN